MLGEILFFGIASLLMPLVVAGLVVYGIVVWRRRSAHTDAEDEVDEGIGTILRLYFYIVGFVSLMMSANGIVLVVRFMLEALFEDVVSQSNVLLASGVSLVVVGLPLWVFHWRFMQRKIGEIPSEARSLIRKFYVYVVMGVSGGFVIYSGYELLRWAFGDGEFSGYHWGALLVWGSVWAFHWRIEEGEGQPTIETLTIRRMYIYLVSLAGLVMLCTGVGQVVDTLLQEGYYALTGTAASLLGDSGLWHAGMQNALSVVVVGGAVWALHWLWLAGRDYGSGSVLRQVYLWLFAVFGGVMVCLVAVGSIIYEVLIWVFGVANEVGAEHFDFLPEMIAALSVGVGLWAYHWFTVQREAEVSANESQAVQRIYAYILAGIGTGTLAIGIFILVEMVISLLLVTIEGVVVIGDRWGEPLAAVITLGVLGGPLWAYYWMAAQRRVLAAGVSEIGATARRIFIFAALGVGVLSLLGSVSALLFIVLRDLLDFSLSLDTLDDMSIPVAIIAAVLAFLPYYWGVYRQDRDAMPEEPQPQPDVVRQFYKPVLLLMGEDGGVMERRLSNALGYEVETLRWADADATVSVLSDEEYVQVAQDIADAAGSRVVLIPDGGGLRVLSYD